MGYLVNQRNLTVEVLEDGKLLVTVNEAQLEGIVEATCILDITLGIEVVDGMNEWIRSLGKVWQMKN